MNSETTSAVQVGQPLCANCGNTYLEHFDARTSTLLCSGYVAWTRAGSIERAMAKLDNAICLCHDVVRELDALNS